MSMLSQIFGPGHSAPVTDNNQNIQQQSAENKGNEYLSRLSSGQTVEGKVTDIKGNDVQIELPNGGKVTAKLDNAMNLSEGQTLTFEVRANSGSQISLTPLYTNLTVDPTAAKALTAAGMSVNAQTMAMTTAMMEGGMNIDSKSLGDMYHLITSMPEAEPGNLVEMQRLGLPINEESVAQYSAFKNYESQISEGMREVADGAIALFDELQAGEGGEAKAMHFMKELTDVFAQTPEMTETAEAAEQGGKVILSEDGTIKTAVSDSAADTLMADIAELFEAQADKENVQPKLSPQEEALKLIKDAAAADKQPAEIRESGNPAQNVNDKIVQLLNKMDGGELLAQQLKDMAPTDQNALKLSNALLKIMDEKGSFSNKELEAELKELFKSEDFKNVVKNSMKDSWSLRPDQVADKANVEQLYQRLEKQTHELTRSLSQLAEPGSQFAQSLGNMSNNLDFMNQMNQAMQYIQLPLKMNGSDATGDLYVYTDKKSLAAKDGNVSAMLHLDMENLGTVDVYAAISSGNKVTTRFYLESDEVIDLIAEHIHELDERLEKRGYSCSTKLTTRDQMGKDDENVRSLMPPAGEAKLISKQSFDMRA
ncbi:MAG: flagellar hook-length control protein FliK [Lachnospiraceae bacterium]|nr:flagellar hook-length control protein FliK [Lachnospiraceae bacterium]